MTSSLQFHYSIVGLIVKFGLTNEMCDMIVLCSAQYAESVGYLTFIEFGRQIFHLLWVGNHIMVCNGHACACPAQLDIVTMLIGMVTRPHLFALVFVLLQGYC
jgi:hypothetical protein